MSLWLFGLGLDSVRLFIINADIVVLSFTHDLCVIIRRVVRRHLAFEALQLVQLDRVMQGLHLTGDSCHRLLARPAIPEHHRLHHLIDHVSHGQSVLRGVRQGVTQVGTATRCNMFSALSPPAGVGARQILPLQLHRPLMRNSIVSSAGCSEPMRHRPSGIIDLGEHVPHGVASGGLSL